MIFIFPFFCISNLILTYFYNFNVIYYITFWEGLLLILLSYKLSSNNIFYPFKKNISINFNDLKMIKNCLLASSLIFIISFPLYIFNILPMNTSFFILDSLPILLSGFIFSKLRKIKKI